MASVCRFAVVAAMVVAASPLPNEGSHIDDETSLLQVGSVLAGKRVSIGSKKALQNVHGQEVLVPIASLNNPPASIPQAGLQQPLATMPYAGNTVQAPAMLPQYSAGGLIVQPAQPVADQGINAAIAQAAIDPVKSVNDFFSASQQGKFVGPTCRETAATMFTADAVIDYRGPTDTDFFKQYPAGLDGLCEFFAKSSTYGQHDLKASTYTKGNRVIQILNYVPGFSGENAKKAKGRITQYNVVRFDQFEPKIAGIDALFDKPSLFDELKFNGKINPIKTPQMNVAAGAFRAFSQGKLKGSSCMSNVGSYFTADAVVDARGPEEGESDESVAFFRKFPAGHAGICDYYGKSYGISMNNLTVSLYARGEDVIMVLNYIPQMANESMEPEEEEKQEKPKKMGWLETFVMNAAAKEEEEMSQDTGPVLEFDVFTFNPEKTRSTGIDAFFNDGSGSKPGDEGMSSTSRRRKKKVHPWSISDSEKAMGYGTQSQPVQAMAYGTPQLPGPVQQPGLAPGAFPVPSADQWQQPPQQSAAVPAVQNPYPAGYELPASMPAQQPPAQQPAQQQPPAQQPAQQSYVDYAAPVGNTPQASLQSAVATQQSAMLPYAGYALGTMAADPPTPPLPQQASSILSAAPSPPAVPVVQPPVQPYLAFTPPLPRQASSAMNAAPSPTALPVVQQPAQPYLAFTPPLPQQASSALNAAPSPPALPVVQPSLAFIPPLPQQASSALNAAPSSPALSVVQPPMQSSLAFAPQFPQQASGIRSAAPSPLSVAPAPQVLPASDTGYGLQALQGSLVVPEVYKTALPSLGNAAQALDIQDFNGKANMVVQSAGAGKVAVDAAKFQEMVMALAKGPLVKAATAAQQVANVEEITKALRVGEDAKAARAADDAVKAREVAKAFKAETVAKAAKTIEDALRAVMVANVFQDEKADKASKAAQVAKTFNTDALAIFSKAAQEFSGASQQFSALSVSVNESVKSRSLYSLETFNCGRFSGSQNPQGSHRDWAMGLSYTFSHRMNKGCLTLPSPLDNSASEINMVALAGCSIVFFDSPLCSGTQYKVVATKQSAAWIRSAELAALGLNPEGQIGSVKCSCP